MFKHLLPPSVEMHANFSLQSVISMEMR